LSIYCQKIKVTAKFYPYYMQFLFDGFLHFLLFLFWTIWCDSDTIDIMLALLNNPFTQSEFLNSIVK
jgi:hypothetical protein